MKRRLARAGLIAGALAAVLYHQISTVPDTVDGAAPVVATAADEPAPAAGTASLPVTEGAAAAAAAAETAVAAASIPGAASARPAQAPGGAASEPVSAPAAGAATAGPGASVPAPRVASAPLAAPSAASAASAAPPTSVAKVIPASPCPQLVRQLPNLTEALCEAARLRPSGAFSVEGFPLYQRDVTLPLQPVAHREGGPRPMRRLRVLVIGAIHGDELSSASLAIHWIAHALESGAEMDWRFIPALNPDGLLQKRPSRTNARGIDLNRNFPTPQWDPDAHDYWIKRTKRDLRRYPGPEPLSEPESRFVHETMERWKPDLVVSIHAPFGVLDYDGPSMPPERLGRLFLDRVGIYPGSLGNYGGVHRGVPVVTIELPSAVRTPTEAEMRQMWIDLLRWISERLSPLER